MAGAAWEQAKAEQEDRAEGGWGWNVTKPTHSAALLQQSTSQSNQLRTK